MVPLAAYVALRSYTSTQSDPAGNAEAAFLSLLVAGVLAAIAALGAGARWGRGPAEGAGAQHHPELAVTALLATATVWIAYQGPSRGAVVSLILVIGLAVSAARALLDERGRLRGGRQLTSGVTVPLALGLQFLMRGDLLLAPLFETRTLTSLLALPLVAGVATSVLAASLGRRRALLAGGLTAVLAPGWTVTSTLALVALAAGAVFADATRPRAQRWAAVAALALLPLWSLPAGLLFTVGALAIAAPSLATGSLLLVAVVVVVLFSGQVHTPVVAIRLWVGAMLLVPAAALAAGPGPRTAARPDGLGQKAEPEASGFWGVAAGLKGGPDGRWQLRLGAILTLAAAIVSRAPDAMAVGVGVAAFAAPVHGAAASLQRAWCAILVAGTTLFAAYPWVRDDPRGDLLELLGFSNEVSALLALLFLVAGLGFALDRFRDEIPIPAWALRPALLACLLLGLGLGRQATSAVGTTLLIDSYQPVTLAAGSDSWQRDLAAAISGVALDSQLAGGVPIAAGTEVAMIELRADDGSVIAEWSLRAGYETGEWAASRSDLAGRRGFAAPAPWISLVAPGGGFFAHRYRARFAVSSGMAEASRIQVRRGEGLPPETRLSIYRLELRR